MTRWNIEEPVNDDYVGEPPTPLASLVYLRGALRRRWRTWTAGALVGLGLAGLYSWHVPPTSVATVALVLQHPSGSDPTAAMQTDVTILRTRTVAARAASALHEHTSPTAFLHTYSGTATTPDVLTISATAPDAHTAVRRAATIASTYLRFRGEQLRSSAAAQVAGLESQLASLRHQQAAAKAQYAQFAQAPGGQAIAANALQHATSLQEQIGSMETTVQSAQDATDAVVGGSAVLDPAAAVPHAGRKRLILVLVTGLLGGTALGAGVVIFSALTSVRLRRREDVAAAAGAPVTHSVRRLRAGRLTPRWRGHGAAGSPGVQVLAQGLGEVTRSPGGHHVALVTMDNEACGLLVAAVCGVGLNSAPGVFLADLSTSGRLRRIVQSNVGAALRPSLAPTVYRPSVQPVLSRGPLAPGGTALGPSDPDRARWEGANVTIAVAPADLDAGLDHLAGWAEVAVLLVTAGKSSVEQISTTAGLLRSAGIQVRAVLMIGTDNTDHSSGRDLAEPGEVVAVYGAEARHRR